MNKLSLKSIIYSTLISAILIFGACTSAEKPANKPEAENTNKATAEKTNDNPKSGLNPNSFDVKTYAGMSEAEQNKFVAKQADQILQKLGFDKSEKVNGEGLELVKPFIDAYAKRRDTPKKEGCKFGDNLTEMLKRGNEAAKDISSGFKSSDISPVVGIYIAMVESQFCPCLQSPTGLLGMFQLTTAAATDLGLDAKRGASPSTPDDRCKTEAAATAAAKIIKRNADKTEAGALGIPVAVMTYNRGYETKYEVADELKNNPKSQESFWHLLGKTKTSKNPKGKYAGKTLAKFIAAAIVGENPKVFGVDISPLSQVE